MASQLPPWTSYALEKIRMRVLLLDPTRRDKRRERSEMYSSQPMLDDLDKALEALSGALPSRDVELIAAARASLAALRKMIRLDEMDESVSVADAEAEKDRLEAAVDELRALLSRR